MPEVRTNWECDAHGKLATLTLTQKNVLPEGGVWPLATPDILLGYDNAPSIRMRVKLTGEKTLVGGSHWEGLPGLRIRE